MLPSRRRLAAGALLAGSLSAACGSGDDRDETPSVDAGGGDSDVDAGACASGDIAVADTCIRPGVPPGGCGEGFEADGAGGCRAVLPPEPCRPGRMAVPGESSCREVAPCGRGAYGAIPIEASTQFVDAGYPAGDSDGSLVKPWTSIGAGIDAADAGAIVAITDGTYTENLAIEGKAVRLWGRCPDRVTVVGESDATGTFAAITVVGSAASGTEVHAIAIRGGLMGIAASGAQRLLLDQVWIHDVTDRGVDVEDGLGETSATMRDSLIELTREVGVFASGSRIEVEASVIRDTRQAPGDAESGSGLVLQYQARTGRRATGSVRGSLVERAASEGIGVKGSDLAVETSLVRDTGVSADVGFGLQVVWSGGRANATVRSSVIERSLAAGILTEGADLVVDSTVVRDTVSPPEPKGTTGGMTLQADWESGERTTATVTQSLVERVQGVGVVVAGSDVVIDSTIVRDTPADARGDYGRGVHAQGDGTIQPRSTLTLRGSLIEAAKEAGLVLAATGATVEGTLIRDITGTESGESGRGIDIQMSELLERANVDVRSSAVERCREGGIFVVDSDARIDRVVVRDVRTEEATGANGDGIGVVSPHVRASATITGVRVENAARAGISSFGATVTMAGTVLECDAIPIDGENLYGETFHFDDAGGNVCGCAGEAVSCKVVSSNLSPPEALGETH